MAEIFSNYSIDIRSDDNVNDDNVNDEYNSDTCP